MSCSLRWSSCCWSWTWARPHRAAQRHFPGRPLDRRRGDVRLLHAAGRHHAPARKPSGRDPSRRNGAAHGHGGHILGNERRAQKPIGRLPGLRRARRSRIRAHLRGTEAGPGAWIRRLPRGAGPAPSWPRAAAAEPEPARNRRRPRRRATAPACCVRITKVSDKDAEALLEEMGNLGQVRASEREWHADRLGRQHLHARRYRGGLLLHRRRRSAEHRPRGGWRIGAGGPGRAVRAGGRAVRRAGASPAPAPAAVAPAPAAPAVAEPPLPKPSPRRRAHRGARAREESTSIRVGVEKVDQIINLVGELVITQAMLAQTASTLDPVLHDRLLNGMEARAQRATCRKP